ncbi:MAG: guanylate kinase [Bdellovibrionales bacterium]|nr:guanylate kinase [Bdellovibrionales bacterium]
MSNRLVVISAPSGTGKTTLCARLLQEIPELILSISTTTRAPRGQEKHGTEYFFVPKEDFRKKIDAGGFAEWAEVHGNFYGTTKDFVDQAFAAGKSLLLDIDVQGAEQLKNNYPGQTLRIFLAPPSMEELERRLRARGTDSEESIKKRLAAAAYEMAHQEHFDHVVVNDDLEHAYFQLAGIVLQSIRGQTVAQGKGGPKA